MTNLADRVLFSSLIQKQLSYRILFPDDYAVTETRYPVLYLLHGLLGNHKNWTELTSLAKYAGEYKIIIVMPEGGDGWYTDSVEKNESFLIKDLLPEIESNFRTKQEKDCRAIAGNSMGGYGAFKFALKYPEIFGFAISFSGAFNATELCKESRDGNWAEFGSSITRVFGENGSRIRRENSLEDLSARTGKNPPCFYFDCGTNDDFLTANLDLARRFINLGIKFDFQEIEGGHDWTYWDSRIRNLLPVLNEKFELSRMG